MKKTLLSLFTFTGLLAQAQITVTTAKVPLYMQGESGTNNNRTPMYFWAELSGLTPSATYRYSTSMDTLNASGTSNGAGNAYLINIPNATVRRATSQSLSNAASYDSLLAQPNGTYKGWFAVEPTGNGRFAPGNTLYPMLLLNNGTTNATSIANRIKLTAYPVSVITFSNVVSPLYGSAIMDSADVSVIAPKSLVFIYDNTANSGRPLASAIVEMEGVIQNTVTSIATFYRNNVDQYPQRWGTIIPNGNGLGVRSVEYLALGDASTLKTISNSSGSWCAGANTQSPTNGSNPMNLASTAELNSMLMGPPSESTGNLVNFVDMTNAPAGSFYVWDYGDGNTEPGFSNVGSHTYTVAGVYNVTAMVQAPAPNTNCITFAATTITITTVTGLNDHGLSSSISVFPNPSNGVLTIKNHSSNASIMKLNVMNALGEVVLNTAFDSEEKTLDLSNLTNGIYTLKIENGSGSTIQKIILAH
jgi:hypothetical protein